MPRTARRDSWTSERTGQPRENLSCKRLLTLLGIARAFSESEINLVMLVWQDAMGPDFGDQCPEMASRISTGTKGTKVIELNKILRQHSCEGNHAQHEEVESEQEVNVLFGEDLSTKQQLERRSQVKRGGVVTGAGRLPEIRGRCQRE